jgi:UDP-N-acetylmuramoyl-L-alanyl-D-glutamate--2,6-diaminopimelate ligase
MSSPSETLAELATVVSGRVIGDGDVVITDVTHDSRSAGPGVLFVAVRGMTRDGHDFVADVLTAGCPAVVVDHPVDVDISQLVVADTRATLGPLAAAVHGNPSARLRIVGITGTNGKTSVTHMVDSIGRAAGLTTGVIGTIGIRVRDETIPSERTTPEASDFQRLLAGMVAKGADLVACEVSSHALALGRVEATRFSVGAFTNLSQDHLDFHSDMEDYFAQKAKLFDHCDLSVICVDDEWGRRLAAMVTGPKLTVATTDAGGDRPAADIGVVIHSASMRGSSFDLTLPSGQTIPVSLPIPGWFSVANAAVAAGCCLDMVGADAVRVGLGSVPQIPGRFELVSGDDAVSVVVDYSHTPAAVEAAIATARPLTPGRIIAVLGAGGDRDTAKRPLMGAAASRADLVVVTSDNPRSEPPAVIMEAVTAGVTAPCEAFVDRRQAIGHAIGVARPGDTVLIMGKGHEPYQEIEGVRHPFDDRVVAREALAGIRDEAL